MEDIPTWPDDGGEHSITKMLEFCTPIVEGGATLLGAFTDDELDAIDTHAVESGINLWAEQTRD